jgi:hypothetical protein
MQASAAMIALGVAAAALAGRAIVRQAQTGGKAAGGGFMSHFAKMGAMVSRKQVPERCR